ncbi:hypothetical protein OESDEN_00481 [Oesophagostomum dentatum]|uniref:Uncharacterized protein n=1 Tax=Oesophagostomum dentatum TaxID=61180 RepID=A0A0B1TVT3_OESDE|nr:hypothetical protein OESDEN_00481 [Oesophagostomum dentatum]
MPNYARMLREISRRVEWVLVGGRWTRMSIIGTSLSDEVLDRENKGELDNRVVILMIPEPAAVELLWLSRGNDINERHKQKEKPWCYSQKKDDSSMIAAILKLWNGMDNADADEEFIEEG